MFFKKSYPDNNKTYQLDKFSARNSDDIYKTISPLKGEDVPHPYIFVINKETREIEVYKDIVFSEDDDLILCDETRKRMEADDSVITLFDNTFKILIWPCEEYPKNCLETDMIPYIYTKVGNQYAIFHKYNLCYPFADMNNTWDDVRLFTTLGGGYCSFNNLPLIVVRKGQRSIIFTEKRVGSWYPMYGMIYETNDPIESIYYTRTTGSGRWILTKHQIIINNGKDTTILLTERGDDNLFDSKDFPDSTVTPIDEYGEFLLIDPKDKPKYAVRVDKNGYHKSRIMNGRNGTEPFSLPKNMSYMNCLRRPNINSYTYICDEGKNKIYRIQKHANKDNCLEIIEISTYPKTEREVPTWNAFYKNNNIWYAKYITNIPTEKEAIYQEEKEVLLDRNMLGMIDRQGKLSLIPKTIEVPVCKKVGNHYELLPDYKPNTVYNIDLINSGENNISYYAVSIDVLLTNIVKIMRREVPWTDMKLWWHRKR